MTKIIQILSPYSANRETLGHPKAIALEQFRFEEAMRYSAHLISQGHLPLSPIVNCHQMALSYDLPHHFEFWQNYCLTFMQKAADEVHVLALEGWQESKGVKAEIEQAQALGLPILLAQPLDDSQFHVSDYAYKVLDPLDRLMAQ